VIEIRAQRWLSFEIAFRNGEARKRCCVVPLRVAYQHSGTYAAVKHPLSETGNFCQRLLVPGAPPRIIETTCRNLCYPAFEVLPVETNRQDPTPGNLDAVVNEVVAEAHVQLKDLRPDERAFLREHTLKKPLRVLDIWALGVGVVITGAYFGWNLGLKDNGSVAMLLASLIVCLLYLAWVLALA
jgi:hypothetical protein